jgi:hypothetical protein
MGFYRGPNIVTNGLVLALDAGNTKSYPGSGTTWLDKSGNGNNGTLTNGPTFSSANGGSIVFDGTNDSIDSIGSTTSLSFIQNTAIFSICVWVKLTDFSTTQRAIMGNNRNVTSEKGFILSRATFSSRLRFVITNGSGNTYTQNIDDYFLDSDWIFVTIVGNGTNVIYYKNGLLFTTGSAIGTLSTDSSTRSLRVGGIAGGVTTLFWTGNISQTQIYNKALTAQEVLQNYTATKSRYNL